MRDTGAAPLELPQGALRAPAGWPLAALAWLLCVLAVLAHHAQFWREGRLNTDVLALLPQAEQAPEVARAGRVLSQQVARQIVVLVGAPDWPSAQSAAAALRAAVQGSAAPMRELQGAGGAADGEQLLAFYLPRRDRLLTAAQREHLRHAPVPALVQSALAQLHQPGAGTRLHAWSADPLGLWPEWLQARGGQAKARPRDGELWVAGDGMEWAVLLYEITGSPFAMDGEPLYAPALQRGLHAASDAVPQARGIAAGLPLHAEAAAVQASGEISTIGWGSLAAVLLLAWLAFRGFTPIVLTALSLLVGVATALSATALLFGEVHLLTLVFGASLVGVAEDYGIHYFAARQGHPAARPKALMRSLLPGLALALATSVLAYLALGLAPFPGLRQMAVFSATGLAAAFLTAVCWFPLLDRFPVRRSGFAAVIAASLERWPRLVPSRRLWPAGLVAGLFCVAGVCMLDAVDSLRHWQSSPAALVRAQADVGRLLGTPSVAQYYLVRGDSPQQLLQREEALKARLEREVRGGVIGGYAAVSDWVPSLRRQQDDAALSARAELRVVAGVNAALGESLVRARFDAPSLLPQEWLAHPVSAAARHLWLGESGGQWTSLVLLQGLHDAAGLPRLAAAAQGLDGVRWVDQSSDVASVLGRYRWAMTALLLAGHLAVLAALAWRYGRQAWRAWAPTAAASVLAVAALGWLGEPFQLSNVLALLLLLGIGVDYGIFLLEHDGDGSAWLAVVLGAASTWLAFGLLALSGTPALHAFGLTLMIGIAAVWLATPLLRPGAARGPA